VSKAKSAVVKNWDGLQDLTVIDQLESRYGTLDHGYWILTEALEAHPDGPRVLVASRPYLALLGVGPDSILGRNPKLLRHPRSPMDEIRRLRHHLMTWSPGRFELWQTSANSELLRVHLNLLPLIGESGWYQFWLGEFEPEQVQR
jgi:hypothetical protein